MYTPKHSIGNYAIPFLFVAGSLLLFLQPSFIWSPVCRGKLENYSSEYGGEEDLEVSLRRASMANKTVIIAVANKAYADQDMKADTTMLDVFLQSFWLGEDTRALVNHLLIVAVDRTAYDRCRFLGLNCYRLQTEGVDYGGEKVYMSDEFINMMWIRTHFLLQVLQRGYNFIFTDMDVMWLRNPFKKLSSNQSEDLQISTDVFSGDPWGENNLINTGFYFVRSNNKTIALFEKWFNLRENSTGLKEQDVLLELIHGGIIRKLDLKVRFLDTLYFSGFCRDSTDLRQVATVHANCCLSIIAKIGDLQTVLRDWKRFKKIASYKRLANATRNFKWSPHRRCRNSWKS